MPFEKGKSGNPGGRPKSRPFKEALDKAIREAGTGDGKVVLDTVVLALLAKAMSGDVPAIKEVAERCDGKVPQAIVGDDEHDPVRIEGIERRIVDPKHSDS